MTIPTEGILNDWVKYEPAPTSYKIAYRRVLETLPQVVVDQTFKTALVSTSYISNKVFFYRSIIFNIGTFIFDLSQSCLLRVYGTPKLPYLTLRLDVQSNQPCTWRFRHYMWRFIITCDRIVIPCGGVNITCDTFIHKCDDMIILYYRKVKPCSGLNITCDRFTFICDTFIYTSDDTINTCDHTEWLFC